MAAHIDDKVLERYLKVRTLWERTDGNEKANAARVMASMQNTYPGIDQAAPGSPASKRVPQDPGPSWQQAMADAVGVVAGFTSPMDVIHKYAQYIDGIEDYAPAPGFEGDPVELLTQFSRVSVRDSFRGLRVSLEIDPEIAAILDDFVRSPQGDPEISRLAHRAGEMVARKFYGMLKTWKEDR